MDSNLKIWQLDFFDKIKLQVPTHLNFIFEISEILNVSENSVYKRVRAEQLLTLEEVFLLKNNFSFINFPIANSSLLVKNLDAAYLNIDNKNFTLLNYIESLIKKLQLNRQDDNHNLIYAAKDLPVFYFFIFPEIAAFKFYTWKRSVFYLDDYNNRKFDLAFEINKEEIELGKQLMANYCNTNSIEIWCDETLNSLLKQLDYSFAINLFQNKNDYEVILNKILELIDFIELQTSLGFKKSENKKGKFEMYNHEMLLYDNSALAITTAGKISFITHNTSNILQIENDDFCNQSYLYLQKLIYHSVALSRSNEKSRIIFFNELRKKVQDLISKPTSI